MVKGILIFIVFLLMEGVMTLISLVRNRGSLLGITLTAVAATLAVWAVIEKTS